MEYKLLLEDFIQFTNRHNVPFQKSGEEITVGVETFENEKHFDVWTYSMHRGVRKVLFKTSVYFTSGDKERSKNTCYKRLLLDVFMWGTFSNHKQEIAK